MIRRILGSLATTLIALTALVAPAQAAPTELEGTTDYLAELEEIAGRSAHYLPTKSTSLPVATPAALDPAGCELFPSRTHLRKSGGYGTMGAKPYTRCGRAVTRINQSSTLYIVEWAGLYSKPMMTREATSRGVASLTQKNLDWKCQNSNKSKFQQVTRGTTTIGTKNYYSIVSTIKENHLCGY